MTATAIITLQHFGAIAVGLRLKSSLWFLDRFNSVQFSVLF